MKAAAPPLHASVLCPPPLGACPAFQAGRTATATLSLYVPPSAFKDGAVQTPLPGLVGGCQTAPSWGSESRTKGDL